MKAGLVQQPLRRLSEREIRVIIAMCFKLYIFKLYFIAKAREKWGFHDTLLCIEIKTGVSTKNIYSHPVCCVIAIEANH